MTFIEQKIPTHHPDLVWQEVDDGVVIVAPQEGKVRALNSLGSRVWKMINGEQTLNTIFNQLCQNYVSISSQQIERDLTAFVDDLDKRNLIVWQKAE